MDLVNRAGNLFFEAMCRRDSITELAKAMYEIFEWPVIIGDDTTNVLLQVPDEAIGSWGYDELLKQGEVAPDMYACFQNLLHTAYNPEGNPIQLIPGEDKLYPWQVYLFVRTRNKITLQVILHLPKESLSDEEMHVIEMFHQALESECRKLQKEESFPTKRMGHKLRKLIENSDNEKQMDRYAIDLSKEFPGGYVVSVALLESDIRQESFIPFYINQANKILETKLCISYGNNIVVLSGEINGYEGVPRGWDKFLKFNESCAITMGISSEFSDIRHIAAYYQQALLTARLGKHMNFKDYIFRFETFEPLQMYYPIAMEWQLETFLHPAIREMIEWDKKYNTEYLKTLRAYLVTNKSTKESVRLLMVHQNTLMYRLQKIRELFKIDFADGKLTLTLLSNILLLEVARPELLPLFPTTFE